MSTRTAPAAAVGPRTAYLLAAASMIIYSSPPVVTRAVSVGVPPLALSLSRWAIALVILLPWASRRLPAEWPKLKSTLPSLVLLAAFMIVGSTLSVIAVYYTTATNAVLVNASQPAITATLAWLIAGARLSPAQRLGIACAFTGIVVMIARADLGVLLGLDLNVGDLIMLGAVAGWSTYAVLLPRRDYAPDGLVLMFLISLTGTIFLLPAYLIEAARVGSFELTGDVVAAMLYLSIFPSLLATFSWNAAIRAVGANRTAIFVNLIPISGAVLAMVFLGERLYAYHLAGAAFVFAGIWLALRRR
ncbi:MAG: DMT family transporter [Gammaproteobacteria bacterium]|nr:DMT family transporter [Gammaproteobacteria bacterium]